MVISPLGFVLVIGVPFSLLAGAMAALIAWQEYSRHFQDRWQPLGMTLRMAGATTVFFLLLTLVWAVYLDWLSPWR